MKFFIVENDYNSAVSGYISPEGIIYASDTNVQLIHKQIFDHFKSNGEKMLSNWWSDDKENWICFRNKQFVFLSYNKKYTSNQINAIINYCIHNNLDKIPVFGGIESWDFEYLLEHKI